ncbi:MAG: DUF2863 family protein [Burkholderiaceae bacterium]|jgi:hypothetical protein
MRRSPKNPIRKFSAESQRLASLAQSMVRASSRIETRAWETRLDSLLQKQLANNQQQAIDNALDHLFHTDLDAYDTLLDSIEAISSSCTIEEGDKRYDALLIAIPVLAWTRFTIPSGPINATILQTISAQLHGHILAANTRAAVAPVLFSIDQLPRSYCETYQLTRRMAESAISGKAQPASTALPETAAFLADTRHLLALVTAESGQPLLRWQEDETGSNLQTLSQSALTQWQLQAGPNLQNLLPGCGIELLLPSAYYVACREADKAIRPISLRAAVYYLTHVLSVEPAQLSAVIAAVGDEASDMRVDEFRISYSVTGNNDVVYGVVWPLYDEESAEEYVANLTHQRAVASAQSSPLQQIISVLRESGITRIQQADSVFPPEYCDDCGAPLFCDTEEEMVHAEMPEDAGQNSGHLH